MASVTVGAKPGQLDLTGIRGDKWGPIELAATTPVDLSGKTWLAQVRVSKDRPAEVIADIVVDDTAAASGILVISILPAESSNLATGPDAGSLPTGEPFQPGKAVYYWDIQATDDGDATDVKTWFAGKVIVEGDVAGSF